VGWSSRILNEHGATEIPTRLSSTEKWWVCSNNEVDKCMKKCNKCGEEKPLAEFNRRLTRAQMQARGMKGDVLMTISSKNCKACQPKRTPPSKKTRKELHNMVVSGDIGETRVTEILEERQRMAKLVMSKARYEAWVDKWRTQLKATLDPMTYEIKKVRAQRSYAEDTGQGEYEGLLEKYLSILTREKNRIWMDFEAEPSKYKKEKRNWWELVSSFAIESLRDRWLSIGREDREHMKVPELLSRRRED
jgi:hypothetical protein